MILWLTGNSGSGKTTLGKLLAMRLGAVLLDGDEMRHSISLGAGFSKEDREEHNLRVARLAQVLEAQGHTVIVTVIAPFESTRAKIDKLICPLWVYVFRPSVPEDPDRPYEVPGNHITQVNTDSLLVWQGLEIVTEAIEKLKGVS